MKLLGKIFISGKITALTGLAIGGSNTDIVIGGIDNNVIKTSEGVPYIPGSSLKGKMRSLLELAEKHGLSECDNGDCEICIVFGTAAEKRTSEIGPTRLLVRDAYLNKEIREKMENKVEQFKELELTYTEGKWENQINRITSKANPRQMERVPAGAEFDFSMVFNVLEKEDLNRFRKLIIAINLLEDDYLGGSGSRGYGRIKFSEFKVGVKSLADYESNNTQNIIFEGTVNDFNAQEEDWKAKLAKGLGVE